MTFFISLLRRIGLLLLRKITIRLGTSFKKRTILLPWEINIRIKIIQFCAAFRRLNLISSIRKYRPSASSKIKNS